MKHGKLAMIALALMSGASMGQMAHAKEIAPKVKLTARQATAVAKKKYPGKITKKTVLENEDGKWEYAVMVKSGKTLREIMVDANTGQIVDEEVTTEAKEAAEARAEAKAKGHGAEPKEKDDDEKDEKK